MTRSADADRDSALKSRRRFLRDTGMIGGAAVAGALGASEAGAADSARMDEDARRSHGQPALWDAIAIREERCQEHPQESQAISIRLGAHAAAGPRRHHHAEWAVL